MSPQSYSILFLALILFIPLVFVLRGKLRMDLAALIMALALAVLQLLGWGMIGPFHDPSSVSKTLIGLSQPVIFTLISLFIITLGLEKSGVTRWLAQRLLRISGNHLRLMIGLFALTTAVLSLFMNSLAAAALLLPSAMEVSRQTGIKPSKLLIPVSFGSLFGGMATFFTTANIVVSDLLTIADPPQAPLRFLDFTPTGGLVAAAGILFLTLAGKYLLKDREPAAEQVFVRYTGSELEDFYQINNRLWEARVQPDSLFSYKAINHTDLGKNWGVVIAAMRHNGQDYNLPAPEQIILPEDELLIIGREEKINLLRGLGLDICSCEDDHHLTLDGILVAEILLSPHSSVVGKSLKEMDFRKNFGLTVIALRRLNHSYRTDVGNLKLEFGDSLLVIGNENKIRQLKRSSSFIVLEANPADQPVQRKEAFLSIGIIFSAIAASIAGVPVYIAMLAGAILSILLGLVSMDEAYKHIEWQVIFLIAGMYVVSLALVQTGAASLLGSYFLTLVEPLGGMGVALGAFVFSMGLTQVLGSQVTALVAGPIVLSAAINLGVSPQAVAVATAIGCSASFLTPIAHPVNILTIGPANYRFTDFLRIGWVLVLITFGMLALGLKLFWGF